MDSFGIAGQRRLATAAILIVGAGGLGSPAAMYLAAAGVGLPSPLTPFLPFRFHPIFSFSSFILTGRLGLVDDDDVDLSNLHRQVIHSEHFVGTKKVCHSFSKSSFLSLSLSLSLSLCGCVSSSLALTPTLCFQFTPLTQVHSAYRHLMSLNSSIQIVPHAVRLLPGVLLCSLFKRLIFLFLLLAFFSSKFFYSLVLTTCS